MLPYHNERLVKLELQILALLKSRGSIHFARLVDALRIDPFVLELVLHDMQMADTVQRTVDDREPVLSWVQREAF
jgi:DNA-binding HxlR family transcriptional regulator